MRTPTPDAVIATTQRVMSHWHRHRHSGDSHERVLAKLADRIERNGSAMCTLTVESTRTGTTYTLTCMRDGVLAGRAVTVSAAETTWWVVDGGTCTRTSMTAFGSRFLTPAPRTAATR